MTRKINGYGWTPSLPDHRSKQFERTTPTINGAFDSRPQDVGIYDQKNFPTSTANAVAGLYRNAVQRHLGVVIDPSRMAIYETTRMVNGGQAVCSIGDTFDAIRTFGIVNEKAWKYQSSNFLKKLPKSVWGKGRDWIPFTAYTVQTNENEMIAALMQNQNLIVGLTVYESFVTSKAEKTGKIPLPSIKEDRIGGIAAEVVAYDLSDYTFTIKSNWGSKWGKNGYLTLPIGYLTNPNLAGDMWTISCK